MKKMFFFGESLQNHPPLFMWPKKRFHDVEFTGQTNDQYVPLLQQPHSVLPTLGKKQFPACTPKKGVAGSKEARSNIALQEWKSLFAREQRKEGVKFWTDEP